VNRKASRVDASIYAVENFLVAERRRWQTRLPKLSRRSSKVKVYDRGMENGPGSEVAAFILAGGKSTRMGTDKAFVEYDGRTLLARALSLARSVTADVRIVGSQEKFARFAPVVEDIFGDCGPLAGIHSALRSSPAELNLMLAVDMPFVSGEFLLYLISQARSLPEVEVVVPLADRRRQPLCAIYRREFADAAENALRAGQNRIDRLFDEVRTRVIEEEELEDGGFSSAIFRNLNTPEELDAQPRRA
jgi:molybdopterin-guanine dinucleotide biosynthesis protein A